MKWTKIGLYASIGVTGLLILGFLGESLGVIGGSGQGYDANRTVYLLCVNPDCGAELEVTQEEYMEMMREEGGDMMMMGPMMGPTALTCPECEKKSAYIAEKCKECGTFFTLDYQNVDDYPDRCPECGYSEMENRRK